MIALIPALSPKPLESFSLIGCHGERQIAGEVAAEYVVENDFAIRIVDRHYGAIESRRRSVYGGCERTVDRKEIA